MDMEASVAAEHATAVASAPTPTAAGNQERSTFACANDIELELMDVPNSSHKPPNAHVKARDENRRLTYATAHQELFANLYNEF
jgi:hypothetical protein